MLCKVGIISKSFPAHFTRVDFLSTVTSQMSPKGGVASEGVYTFLTRDGGFMTEALHVSLRPSPRVLTVTGFVHTLWFPVGACTRDTCAGSSAFLTGMRFMSSGRPWLTRAGFSTLSALMGFNSGRMSLLHREICDLVRGVYARMSFIPLTGSPQPVTSVRNRKHTISDE